MTPSLWCRYSDWELSPQAWSPPGGTQVGSEWGSVLSGAGRVRFRPRGIFGVLAGLVAGPGCFQERWLQGSAWALPVSEGGHAFRCHCPRCSRFLLPTTALPIFLLSQPSHQNSGICTPRQARRGCWRWGAGFYSQPLPTPGLQALLLEAVCHHVMGSLVHFHLGVPFSPQRGKLQTCPAGLSALPYICLPLPSANSPLGSRKGRLFVPSSCVVWTSSHPMPAPELGWEHGFLEKNKRHIHLLFSKYYPPDKHKDVFTQMMRQCTIWARISQLLIQTEKCGKPWVIHATQQRRNAASQRWSQMPIASCDFISAKHQLSHNIAVGRRNGCLSVSCLAQSLAFLGAWPLSLALPVLWFPLCTKYLTDIITICILSWWNGVLARWSDTLVVREPVVGNVPDWPGCRACVPRHPLPALSPAAVSSLSWKLWAHTLWSELGPIRLFGALPSPPPPLHLHLSSGIVLTWRVSVLHAWLLAGSFLFQVATWRSGNQGVCQAAPGGSLSTGLRVGACLDCMMKKPVLCSTKSVPSANVPCTLQRWAAARGLTLERPALTWNEVELTGWGV